MNKKSVKKALLLVLCAILLVVASVMGTLAYLTSGDEVTNTFTAGKVKITLDEAKTNEAGEPVDAGDNVVALTDAPRVDTNDFTLVPGHKYIKDPTIHVEANSEVSYLYVKIENGIYDIESKAAGYKSIQDQMAEHGWNILSTVPGVFFQKHETKTDSEADYVIFDGFTIDTSWDNDDLALYDDAEITLEAFAIQADGLSDALTAWNALQAQITTP